MTPVDPARPQRTRHQRRQGLSPTRSRELQLQREGMDTVAGVDEVGRGPLAGPVAAAAVVLPRREHPGWVGELRDSKQLSADKRRRLAAQIRAGAADWAVGWAAVREVDDVGILQATRLAMRRALAGLSCSVEYALVDGRDRHSFDCPYETIIGGDATEASIAAASIVAKVARDAWMEAISTRYRDYGFRRNKGYGTAEHIAALQAYGPCAEHRFSFAPVRASRMGTGRPADSPSRG